MVVDANLGRHGKLLVDAGPSYRRNVDMAVHKGAMNLDRWLCSMRGMTVFLS